MTNTPTPYHFTLDELIARLQAEPDQSKRVRIGFKNPHSYRGYYEQVAFEVAYDVTIGQMYLAALSALGSTYQGWKGGDYIMNGYTDTWLVAQKGTEGETLGAVLLDFILGAESL